MGLFEQFFTESKPRLNSPRLKAIFVDDGARSAIRDALFAGTGLRELFDPDVVDRYLRYVTLPKMPKPASSNFKDPRVFDEKMLRYTAGAKGSLLINCTNWNPARVRHAARQLQKVGYDTHLFVLEGEADTLVDLDEYSRVFGAKYITVIEDDAEVEAHVWSKAVSPRLKAIAARVLEAPLRNPIGKKSLGEVDDADPGGNGEGEPESDFDYDEVGYSINDVQGFYDMQILGGATDNEAVTATKRKFKLKNLTVSPVGRVMVPGIKVPRPTPSDMQVPTEPPPEEPPPEEPAGDEEPSSGGGEAEPIGG